MKIKNIIPVGKKECFCVSTNTGQYLLNNIIHHNSVTIQNVIMHSLAHNDEIALALVDPKIVEFSNYKGMKGIVGVANSIQETVELLRIGRAVMYKRNQELAKLGCKQVSEYKPHEYSGKIFVCGREYNESDMIKVKIDGEEKQMTALEVAEYLNE